MTRPSFPISLTALMCAAAVVLGACTTTDPETAEQIDAIRDQVNDLGGGGDLLDGASPEELACLDDAAPSVDLEAVITDSTQNGVEERVRMMTSIIDCLPDLRENEVYVRQFTSNIDAALGGADLDTDEGSCMIGFVLDESPDPGRFFADGSGEEDAALFLDAADQCFDDSSLGILYGEEGSGAQAYGDDPRLDALYDDCAAGDDDACDLLYMNSAAGSEYAELAVDCADRGSGLDPCAEGFVLTDTGDIDPNSPVFARLRSECTDGDMTSCDLLYRTSPLGSDDEQFGFTCGGKIAIGAIPDCRTRFDD